MVFFAHKYLEGPNSPSNIGIFFRLVCLYIYLVNVPKIPHRSLDLVICKDIFVVVLNENSHILETHHAEELVNPKVRAQKKGY
jgi:hypothetical protein